LPYVTTSLEKYAALGGFVDENGHPVNVSPDVLALVVRSLCLIARRPGSTSSSRSTAMPE
jgi:hypothetical protein